MPPLNLPKFRSPIDLPLFMNGHAFSRGRRTQGIHLSMKSGFNYMKFKIFFIIHRKDEYPLHASMRLAIPDSPAWQPGERLPKSRCHTRRSIKHTTNGKCANFRVPVMPKPCRSYQRTNSLFSYMAPMRIVPPPARRTSSTACATSAPPAPRGHGQLFKIKCRPVFPLEGHAAGKPVPIGQAVQDGPPIQLLGQRRIPQEGSACGAVLFREVKSLGDGGERLPDDLRRCGDVFRRKLRNGVHGPSRPVPAALAQPILLDGVHASSHTHILKHFSFGMRFMAKVPVPEKASRGSARKAAGKGGAPHRRFWGRTGKACGPFPPETLSLSAPVFHLKHCVPPPSAPCRPRRRRPPRTGRKSR